MLKELRQLVQEFSYESRYEDAVRMLVRRVREAMGTDVCSIYLHENFGDGFVG